MKYLLIGLVVALLGATVSGVLWGWGSVYVIPAIIAILFVVLPVITSGAMVNGDRMRANLSNESKIEREARTRTITHSFLIASPNIAVAFLLYFLSH